MSAKVMVGAELRTWARAVAATWWDRRWEPARQRLEDVISDAYLRGAIDALKEQTERVRNG